jgi:large subunit ribosomal protein L28
MARRCEITGKGSQYGHKVSHSNRKTKTRFLPNLQNVSLQSDALGRRVSLRITASTIRSIEHNGGLDAYLMRHAAKDLTEEAARLKRQIKRKLAEKAEKAA